MTTDLFSIIIMNTETPQTNTAKFTHQDACLEGMRPERELVDAYFAQTLERERDEARRCAESYRDEQKATYTAAGGEWDDKAHLLPWENAERGDGASR